MRSGSGKRGVEQTADPRPKRKVGDEPLSMYPRWSECGRTGTSRRLPCETHAAASRNRMRARRADNPVRAATNRAAAGGPWGTA